MANVCDLTDHELRAYRAWRIYCSKRGAVYDEPSVITELTGTSGLRYVQLANINGTLCVYRVQNNGNLRMMRRPPADLR